MKNISLVLALFLCLTCNKKEEVKVVEISCGQCQFDLTSEDGCSLAVRFDDKAYFVDGADIDDFGDAHAEGTGFCEVIRKAEVTGVVLEDRFKATSVNMLD